MDKTPEQLYNEREKRIEDAITLKKPDRIPVFGSSDLFAQERCNISLEEQMMDPDKAIETALQVPDECGGPPAYLLRADKV